MAVKNASRKTAIGRKAFDLFIKNNCHDDSLLVLAEELGISVAGLKLNYLIPYTKRVINPRPTSEQLIIYRNHRANQNQQIAEQSEMVNFIHELLELKYAKQVVEFITHCDYGPTEMFRMIDEYTKRPLDEETRTKLARINRVIAECQDILKNKAPKPVFKSAVIEDLELQGLTQEIIEQYLIVDYIPFDDIMAKYSNQITVAQFGKYLERLANGNAEERFLIERLTRKLDYDALLFEMTINEVVLKIRRGLIGSFGSSSFSILDYYRSTPMKIESFLVQAHSLFKRGKLSGEEYSLIEDFVKDHEHGNAVVSEKELIDYQGVDLDYFSKTQIITYIKSISAPLTLNTYRAGYQEFTQNKTFLKIPSPAV